MDEVGPLYVTRTPWRHRLIVWPGMWFRTLPLPYLFHRYDVVYDIVSDTGKYRSWCRGFFRRRSADRWLIAAEAAEEGGNV